MTGRGDLFGAGLLGGIVLSIVLLAEIWARLGRPHPEWTRKFVHLGGCIPALFFPFLVESPWIVLGMALSLSALFHFGSRGTLLRSLHAVERRTKGSEYYPLAVFVLFLIAKNRPEIYVSSLLVLGVADAFAALVGGTYGRIHYQVEKETKSLEGSLVFLVIAFLAVHLPLLLMTDLPRPLCVLAALLTALLVTGFEAISLRGTDNLFIPLTCYIILDKILDETIAEALYQNVSLLGLIVFIGWLSRRARTFNVGATLILILFTYAAWSMVSWQWALPPLLGLWLFVALVLFFPPPPERRTWLRLRGILQAHLPPLIPICVANLTQEYGRWQAPYLAAYAVTASSAIWLYRMWSRPVPAPRRITGSALAGLLTTAIVTAPSFLLQSAPLASWLAILAVGMLFSVLHDRTLGSAPKVSQDSPWTATRFIISCIAALAFIALQNAGVLPVWPHGVRPEDIPIEGTP